MYFSEKGNIKRKLVLAVIVALLILPQVYRPGTKSLVNYDTVVSGNITSSDLDDSMPHYNYKRIEDSLERVDAEKDFQYRHKSSWNFFKLGISENESGLPRYFFDIHGYRLKESVEVKPAGQQTLVRFPVWKGFDTTVSNIVRKGSFEEKTVPVKYFQEEGLFKDYVSLPINRTSYQIFNFLMVVIMVLCIAGFVYFLLALPFRILVMISRGHSFHPDTFRSLYRVGWFLIVISLLNSLSPIIFHILFNKQIPGEFEFSYYAALAESFPMIVVGLIIVLFADAFKQGYKLQQEQELTV